VDEQKEKQTESERKRNGKRNSRMRSLVRGAEGVASGSNLIDTGALRVETLTLRHW